MLRLPHALALALVLTGCATTQRLGAAGDVHAFLVSIRDNDRVAFDAHIDRPALQRQLEDRLMAQARKAAPSGPLADLAQAVAGPLAQYGADNLLQPSVFRNVAIYFGYDPAKPLPGQIVIAKTLRPLSDGRVCAPRSHDGPCLFTFTHEAAGWKLTSFDGEMSDLNRR
ncbi:MAG: hypothetical protein JWM33_2495 [Caulobacteraceae bacterium]|nr:hypothetical protein [Caulobacteraceae bacterium]